MNDPFALVAGVEPERILVLGSTIHVRWRADYSETLFLDGTKVPAMAIYDDTYRDTAQMCGYAGLRRHIEDAINMMCWEHEVMHTLLARCRGLNVSRVLWDVAHGKDQHPNYNVDASYQEEAEVIALQTWLNTSVMDSNLDLWKEFDLWTLRNQLMAALGRTRWIMLPYTSTSGKLLFQCDQCMRISATPDKVCRRPHTGQPDCTS